jgi:hypothetical protein
VLQHFGRNGSACHGGCAEHRLIAADQQNFAKLHDRPDIAGDLAYLEHIIRNDAVLPAAGFDDCEHRFIPSCSIPASERVRAGFFFSRYGFTATIGTVANFRAIGERSLKSAQKQAARGISRAGWGTYSREVP